MKNSHEGEEAIGSLVRGELSAVETYKQALEKVGTQTPGEELRRIEQEHEDAVLQLQEFMEDVSPPEDSGLWGSWAKAVEGAAKLFGAKAAIKALKEGEERGISAYEAALRDEALSGDVRQVIMSELLPKTRAHVASLDKMLQQPGSGR